jgi:hypothetical protein
MAFIRSAIRILPIPAALRRKPFHWPEDLGDCSPDIPPCQGVLKKIPQYDVDKRSINGGKAPKFRGKPCGYTVDNFQIIGKMGRLDRFYAFFSNVVLT